MTTYGEHKQFINLGQEPDLAKIKAYNTEVGCSAKLPTGAVEGTQIGYEHSGIVMTDMWVLTSNKVKMCRYMTIGEGGNGNPFIKCISIMVMETIVN